MKRVPPKTYTSQKDVEDASPEELVDLLFHKAQTKPEGSTAQTAVDTTLRLLEEREELRRTHRSGRPKGAFGVARAVVERLAPTCATLDERVSAMKRERNAQGPVLDFEDDDHVVFLDQAKRERMVSIRTLADYLREARRGK